MVHKEGIVPIGYDPLLQRLSLNEQVTYHAQQDLLPFFFPFKNQDDKMSRDKSKTELIESLIDNLRMAADFGDQVKRLKGLVSGYPKFTNFFMQSLTPIANSIGDRVTVQEPATLFTAYVCPRCVTGLLIAWNGSTAKEVHEKSCQRFTPGSNTASSMNMQSIRDSLVKQIVSATETAYPSKRYVECIIAFDDITGASFVKNVFNLVELKSVTASHWAMRANRDEKTEINPAEMNEFITTALANIAIFQFKLNNNSRFYLMMISD
jgi:hypothetical protein